MQILSHRGYWKTPAEKNAPAAFERSFAMGFGTETDLRDLAGRLVIAHDPPAADALGAEEMLAIHARHDPGLPLALNVKSDGLQDMLVAALGASPATDAFVFDMAVPDAVQWLRRTGIAVFTRQSDVETAPALYDAAAGVWLDAFDADWWDAATVARHRDAGKRVCIVSPELHGRDHRPLWDRLAGADAVAGAGAMLCTDLPEDAAEAFGHER